MAKKEIHNAIVTRNTDPDLGVALRGAVFFNAPTLFDGEYPEPAQPCFPFASAVNSLSKPYFRFGRIMSDWIHNTGRCFVDLEVLKKKISTYRTEGGHLTKVSDELTLEILNAWEQWTGASEGFYRAVGVNQRKLAKIIGRGKKLKREGHFPADLFKEIQLSDSSASISAGPCGPMEITWSDGKIIRFQQVEQLVEFLKKSA